MLEIFRKNNNEQFGEKRAGNPEPLLVNAIRKELNAGKSVDWESYKKSLLELSYEAMVRGIPEEIKKISLQIKMFDELRLKHEKHSSSELNWQEMSPTEQVEIKEQIRNDSEGRDGVIIDEIFQSVKVLMQSGTARNDAIRQAIMAHKEESIFLKN
jgi:hypothetical protein